MFLSNKFYSENVSMADNGSSYCCTKLHGIFSEIDGPLDLNENLSTNIVFDVVSFNDVRFKKLFSFKIIYFICNTCCTSTFASEIR